MKSLPTFRETGHEQDIRIRHRAPFERGCGGTGTKVGDGADLRAGRLPITNQGFNNLTDSFCLESSSHSVFDNKKIQYFRKYLKDYFNGPFVLGMGSEDILFALREFSVGGRCLDLGAGTSTLFWYLSVKNVASIDCADVVAEALVVLGEFTKSDRIPQCYADVLEHFSKDESDYLTLKRSLRKYLVSDCFQTWPNGLVSESYDTITAFGTLAIAPDEATFAAALKHIGTHLSTGARAIGAEWVRHDAFKIAEDGRDTGYLTRDMVADNLHATGFRDLVCRKITISGDPLFQSIIFDLTVCSRLTGGARDG